jgi:hypothetical protein
MEDEIVSEGSSEYVTGETGNYILAVTDGTRTTYEHFYVTVDNGLSVSDSTDSPISLQPGTNMEFESSAAAQHGTLKYQWYQQYQSSTGAEAMTSIPDATSSKLTVTIPSANSSDDDAHMIYYCVVTDEYNNIVSESFDVELQVCTHKMTTIIDKAATCGDAGIQHLECTICHTKEEETEIPPTEQHVFGAYEITTQPTATKNGVKTRTCTICGTSESISINKLSSNMPTSNTLTSITASNFARTYSSKSQSFSIRAKCNSTGKLTYSSNNKSVKVNSAGKVTVKAKFIGKATITIKAAASGSYPAQTKKIKVTVNPTKTKLSSLIRVKGSKMTVKWKKNTVGNGYQIQYSTDKKFKTGVKTVNVKKNRTVSKTISNLKKRKTYYVRIRTYKTVSKVKYYSGWSKTKKLKISK